MLSRKRPCVIGPDCLKSPITIRTTESTDPGDTVQMSFGEHLEELRRRLIYSIAGVFVVMLGTCLYGRDILSWLLEPLLEVQLAAKIPYGLYTSSLLTPFTAYMKVSLVSALIIAGPWVVYQFWKFVSAGLYPSERRIFVLMAPVSALLTVLSVIFLYYVMLPAMLAFLTQFSITYPAQTHAGHGFLHWITTKFMGVNEQMSSLGPNLEWARWILPLLGAALPSRLMC